MTRKCPVALTPPALTLVSAPATPVIRSNDGKCELRILGPIALAGKVEWYELTIEPDGELASDAHEEGAKEHLSVQAGSLVVQVAGTTPLVAAQKQPLDETRLRAQLGRLGGTPFHLGEFRSHLEGALHLG